MDIRVVPTPFMSLVFINNPVETFTPTQSGALATVIWECCRAAQKDGCAPFVITRSVDAEPFAWKNTILAGPVPQSTPMLSKCERVEKKTSGWRHSGHRQFALQVASLLKEHQLAHLPLVLHNDPETAIYLRRVFPSANIIHGFHNNLPAHPRIRRQLPQAANALYAVSDFSASWVQEYYAPSQPIHTIYNGVDLQLFHPAESPPADLPVINFVGRTGIEKAPDTLLRAARRLARRTKKFSLQIIGSNHWDRFDLDNYQRHLKYLANGLEREGISVQQTGHLGRAVLPAELRKASINVVPSRWEEPFGLVTLEGMACGLASVASRSGGIPEIVGDAGFIFAKENVEELSEYLFQLVTDKRLRVEYSRKARAKAEEFSWGKTWQSLKALARI